MAIRAKMRFQRPQADLRRGVVSISPKGFTRKMVPLQKIVIELI